MSTVVIGGGGPRPNARVFSVTTTDVASGETETEFHIKDGARICSRSATLAQANALLPLIQAGE